MITKIYTPFPVCYTSTNHQAFRQKPRNNDYNTFAQPCPTDRFLPFQLKLPVHYSTEFDCKIYRAMDNVLVQDLTAFISTNDWEKVSRGGYDYFTYFGQQAFNASEVMECGIYYIRWSDGVYTRYSEIFEVNADVVTTPNYILGNQDEYILGDTTDYILTF